MSPPPPAAPPGPGTIIGPSHPSGGSPTTASSESAGAGNSGSADRHRRATCCRRAAKAAVSIAEAPDFLFGAFLSITHTLHDQMPFETRRALPSGSTPRSAGGHFYLSGPGIMQPRPVFRHELPVYKLPLIIHHRKKCVTCEAGAADLGTGRHTRDSPDRPKRIDRSADHGLEF